MRIRRDVWVISLAFFLLYFGNEVITPFTMLLLRSLGASLQTVGFVASFYNLVLGLSFLLGAGLADKFGGRLVFLLGVLFTVLASISYVMAVSWLYVAVGMMLGRLAWGFRWTSSFSLVSEAADEKSRATSFGVLSTVQYVGSTAGPVIGGVLAYRYDLKAPFYLAVPLLVLSASIALLKVDVGSLRRNMPTLSLQRIRNVLRKARGVGPLITTNMVAQFFFEFGNPFYMILMKESLCCPEYLIGLTASALSVGSIIAGLPLGLVSDRTGRRKPFICVSLAVATVAVAFTAFSVTPWMVVATFFLFGVSNVVGINTVSAYLADMAGSEKNMAYGVYIMAGWLTASLSPPAAGFIAETYGLRMPFLVNLGGLTLATLILVVAFKEERCR